MLISKIIQQIHAKWFSVQKKTTQGVQSARDAVFRGGLIIIIGILIVWVSIFLYTAFYYAYMPSMTYSRPVNLQFKSCDEEKGVCSFPSAHVQLTKKQQLLMVGQPYKVNLQLEMPESPANKELGMFMVCAQLRSRDGVLVDHACRSAMLHYRSSLLHLLSTITYSPMLIFGALEEKQNVMLELFGNFEEDQSHPVTIVHVEIQSRHIEFYSATIMINAHLSGLRYLMFHWPILSAFVGISSNLFFIILICILSYLHFAADEEDMDESFNYERAELEEERDFKSPPEVSDSSSIEDASTLEDIPKSQWTASSSKEAERDPILSKSSYIQEISSLIEESTKENLNK
ncbi:hypothetical protein QAD02_017396 [Eretmocerus hayati]|uniref:Uncharacterized protein n=1 Tax=Eretmocerus hayati TaxID=131215 RepID=A0ACC2PG96_9HYME|nr:hypothetical protein QAD02_017396 [Eretmocerus hayati]